MVSVPPRVRGARRVGRCVRAVIGPTQGNIILALQACVVIHRSGELIGKHPRKICGGLALAPVFALSVKDHQARTCQLTGARIPAAVPIAPRCILMSTRGRGIRGFRRFLRFLQRRTILCNYQLEPLHLFLFVVIRQTKPVFEQIAQHRGKLFRGGSIRDPRRNVKGSIGQRQLAGELVSLEPERPQDQE